MVIYNVNFSWDNCFHCFLHASESKAGRLGATLPTHPGPQRQGLLPDECPPTLVRLDRLDQDLLRFLKVFVVFFDGEYPITTSRDLEMARVLLNHFCMNETHQKTHRSPSDTVVELDPRHPCVGQFGLCHC